MSIQVSIIDGMGSITQSGSNFTTAGATAGDLMGFTSDMMTQAGVVSGLSVSESSPAGMSVDVTGGVCYVENASFTFPSHDTEFWRVVSTTTETVTISSNSSGNDRIDIIVVKVDTSATPDDNATNVGTIEAVEGTPSSSPTAPSTPNNCLKLAEVYVADGATSITNSNITNSNPDILLNNIVVKDYGYYPNTWASARVYMSSAMTNITDGTETVLQFDSISSDIGNNFDTSTYKFTCPVRGVYQASVQVMPDGIASGGQMKIRIKKGTNSRIEVIANDSDNNTTVGTSITEVCSSGDTLYVTVYPTGNSNSSDVKQYFTTTAFFASLITPLQ